MSGTAEAVTGSVAAVASFAAKANRIPGSGKVRGKLVDAAKKSVGAKASDRNLQESIVRYITSSVGGAGAAGAAKGKEKLAELRHKEEEETEQKFLAENERRRERKELDEIDVTGHELDQVLRCETGDKKLDKVSTLVDPALISSDFTRSYLVCRRSRKPSRSWVLNRQLSRRNRTQF